MRDLLFGGMLSIALLGITNVYTKAAQTEEHSGWSNRIIIDSTTTTPEGCTVENFRIFSPSMGREIKAFVILPPEYKKHPEKKYPILYALHGTDSPYMAWAEMSGALAALKSKPMIIASFDGDRYSWFVDSPYFHTDYLRSVPKEGKGTPVSASSDVPPVKSLFTTFFFDEFVPRVERAYPVNGDQRMVTGFSLGAWGAMHYMLARPEMFVSASTLGGGMGQWVDPGFHSRQPQMQFLLGSFILHPERYEEHDLYSRVKKCAAAKMPLPPILNRIGAQDAIIASAYAWDKCLKDSGYPTTYLEKPGKHDMESWKQDSADIVEFHWNLLQETSRRSTGPKTPLGELAIKPETVTCVPPVIVFKFDDVIQGGGWNEWRVGMPISPRWQRLADYIEAHQMKASFGIICESLEQDNPAYFNWIKEHNKWRGGIEFWCHGYRDRTKEDKTGEFEQGTMEEQKKILERCQALAKEKLGAPFHAFGSHWGGVTRETAMAMQAIPEFTIWFREPNSQFYQKACIGSMLRIENPQFVPNFEIFKEAYEKQEPTAKYFTIAGHPDQWNSERWENFVKIAEYLKSRGCIFLTPSELAHFQPEYLRQSAGKAN